MGKPSQFVQLVDAFVAAPKTVVMGNAPPKWESARDDYGLRLKLPLEVGGEHHPGQFLLIDAYPDRNPKEFIVGLMCADVVVCRIDYEPTAVHPNPIDAPVPNVVKGPHWHRWEVNRGLYKGGPGFLKLTVAEPFTQARQFDAVLRCFCAERNIMLGAHPIEFPHPGQLL